VSGLPQRPPDIKAPPGLPRRAGLLVLYTIVSRTQRLNASLRANGSRECAPDDRLREAIHSAATAGWIASSLRSSQ